MAATEIIIPELVMPDEFSWITKSRTDIVMAPFDRAAAGSDYPEIEALQVGRPKEEIPLCTPHKVAIHVAAGAALSVMREDGGPFSAVWADDGMYEEIVPPTSELRITTSPGIAWNRPVRVHEQRAYARLVQNLCYTALKAEGVL